MSKKITFLIAFLVICTLKAQTTFDWDTPTPTDNGDNVTQTIDGITTTFMGAATTGVAPTTGAGGSTGNIVSSSADNSEGTSSVTFSFSEAVDITSVVLLSNPSVIYTFTPTGGSNSVVSDVNAPGGGAIVNLNWTGVTSFVVTSSADFLAGFDNLVLSSSTLSTKKYTQDTVRIYPNPVNDFLYFGNAKNIKSAKIYNSLGQLVSETKETKIDLRNLISGVYILQLNTEKEIINKRIIKK